MRQEYTYNKNVAFNPRGATTCTAMAFDRPERTRDQGGVDSTLRPANKSNVVYTALMELDILLDVELGRF